MQYKELFNRAYQLLRSPRSEWEKITSQEEDTQKTLNDFVLPMAGLCALAAFLGSLFAKVDFEKALVEAIVSLGKTFGGVYFSFFILQETAKRFGLERNKLGFMQLVSYSFVVIFTIDIITSLIPELWFLGFLKLYIFYLVWEGVEFTTKINDEKRHIYVIYAAGIILASSFITQRILYLFMPGAEIIAG